MKKILFTLVLLSLALPACQNSESIVATAISETETARPTNTTLPSPTVSPTVAPTPTKTPRPTSSTCPEEQTVAYLEAAEDLFQQFNDIEKLAQSTVRINLPDLILDMQDLERDLQDLKPPQCAEKTHNALTEYMNSYIDAYVGFYGDNLSEDELTNLILSGMQNGIVYLDESKRLRRLFP